MVEFLKNYWPEIIAIIFSAIALYLSRLAWYKSRAIYDIAKYKLPKAVGQSKTTKDIEQENALRKKLSSGKWQILHIYESTPLTLLVILGRIKK